MFPVAELGPCFCQGSNPGEIHAAPGNCFGTTKTVYGIEFSF